jgi:hypothetical protein
MSIVLLGINYLSFVLLKTTDFFFNKTTVLLPHFQGVNFSRRQGVSLKWPTGVTFIWREGVSLRGFSTIGNSIGVSSILLHFRVHK